VLGGVYLEDIAAAMQNFSARFGRDNAPSSLSPPLWHRRLFPEPEEEEEDTTSRRSFRTRRRIKDNDDGDDYQAPMRTKIDVEASSKYNNRISSTPVVETSTRKDSEQYTKPKPVVELAVATVRKVRTDDTMRNK
jgi:hypothetical protein